jgi:hypothetical protein
VTEAKLLTSLGESLHDFFADFKPLYTPWNEAQKDAGELRNLYQKVGENQYQPLPTVLQNLLFFKGEEVNPAAAVQPIAQCNMVANVTFHLMAQQIAIVLHGLPELDKEKVFATSFENIKKLVNEYEKEIQKEEGKDGETHGQRPSDGSANPSGLSV